MRGEVVGEHRTEGGVDRIDVSAAALPRVVLAVAS